MAQATIKPFTAQALEAPTSWQAWLVPAGGAHPMPENAAKPVRSFVERIAQALVGQYPLKLESFLQVNELHLGDGADLVQEHGVDWMPSIGLGIWPDREPPKPWTRDDFEQLEVGQTVRPLMHQVVRLGGEPAARRHARTVMLGKGSYLELMIERDGDAMLARFQQALGDKLVDPMFKGFPFVCPLLDAAGVKSAKPDDLERWLAGAHLYARDSPEDKGLLLVSKHPLDDIFKALGGESSSAGWSFAIE